MTEKIVNIVFTAPGWEKCPKSGEIWTCNNGYHRLADLPITKLFLMHKQVLTTNSMSQSYYVFDFDHMQKASEEKGFKIVAQHKIPQLKNTEKYPFDKICREFNTTYFTSTHCYMIAYALHKGYEKLRLYGVDFVIGVSKYEDDLLERCGTEFWLGIAWERTHHKVEVYTPTTVLTTRTGEPYAING